MIPDSMLIRNHARFLLSDRVNLHIRSHRGVPIFVIISSREPSWPVVPKIILSPPSFILSFAASCGADSGKLRVATLMAGYSLEISFIVCFEKGRTLTISKTSPGKEASFYSEVNRCVFGWSFPMSYVAESSFMPPAFMTAG